MCCYDTNDNITATFHGWVTSDKANYIIPNVRKTDLSPWLILFVWDSLSCKKSKASKNFKIKQETVGW